MRLLGVGTYMDHSSNDIAERASAYFAQSLHESDDQRREREAWLAADPRHARAYAWRQEIWERAASLRDDPALKKLLAADLAALRSSRRRHRVGWLLAAAAALALLLGGIYLTRRFVEPAIWMSYATPVGERRTEVLADGTRIVLNTDSALEAHYARGQRDVTLQRGEVQFDVAHDPGRPFVVRVGDDSVTALGTRFQVRREADEVTVTLLRGSVEVAQGQERRILHPDERARLSDGAAIRVQTVDPAEASLWLQGRLHFREATLSEVMVEANRYSPRKLRLGDPKLASLVVNGNFAAGDNVSIALAAEQVLPVRVDQHGSEIVLWPK